MRKKWIGAFTALALLALLIPISPSFIPGRHPQEQRTKTRALSVKQEKQLKAADIRHDMEATAQLCASQCSKDIGALFQLAGQPAANRSERMKHLIAHHPQMMYLRWTDAAKSPLSAGKIPADVKQLADKHAALALTSIQSGTRYQAQLMSSAGKRFLMLGLPSPEGNGGIIGLINQAIVGDVQQHQLRNLRQVPYPAEGNYRIESVRAGTIREFTVRTGEDNGGASHYHINEVVIRFRSEPNLRQLEEINRDIQGTSENHMRGVYVFRSRSMETPKMMAYFRKKWNPVYAEPHYLYLTNDAPDKGTTKNEKPIVPNDRLYSDYQWNLPSIEAELGWNLSKGSDNVKIAVLDTGVQEDHPDLVGKLAEGYNVVTPDDTPNDDVGHGTHVAGIIAASVNNSEGVAGLTWYNKIMPVKVLDGSGAGSTYSVAQGLIWAVDNGAKVINMSLGNYAQAEFLHEAIKYAFDRDVVLIAASGNDNSEQPGYPAAYPEVFAVGSTDSRGEKSSFSNYGDYIDVAAPGDSIASTYTGGQYAALSGTSMASPHVAALAALIRSRNPDLSNVEVYDIMRKTARDLGAKGKDQYFGYGQIDIDKALQAAGSTKAKHSASGGAAVPQQPAKAEEAAVTDAGSGEAESLLSFSERLRRRLEELVRSFEGR
ncbi:S8 family peptidase [Paenibacillus pasadenensis]|uniref:S8 family peptidase n=1 Tax=Paenibacillus pasadenensis TaxID=217090 RepID=UPI00203B0D5D|nr:S8 family peptidase [Paenibacillus pasadenensis]MCM3746347.1 S8 family peptidase [Paenibacillus pasadenensis]